MELDVNKTYYGDYFAPCTFMKLLLCPIIATPTIAQAARVP